MRHIRAIDWIMLIVWPLFSAALTVAATLPFLASITLFFIVPAVYFSWRRPSIVRRGLVFLSVSIPFTIVVDYFAMRDGAWYDSSLFALRLLNGIPLEDFLWFGMWAYFIVAVYETFFDLPHRDRVAQPRRARWFVIAWWVAAGLFMGAYSLLGEQLFIPYFYAVFMLVLGVIPSLLIFWWHPALVRKIILVVPYFFGVHVLHELSALTTHQWVFPGVHYIGWVTLFSFSFPLEELLFWMLYGAVIVTTWYEFFVDDGQ
jgi:hypothetical protein